MQLGAFQHRPATRSSQRGFILLILGLFVALLALSILATAPRVAQQIQRDREEEMIHRGAEYARAIRKFVKKNGAYPTSLDQLEETNHIRYLRRPYKDPITGGDWRLLHTGDVPFLNTSQTGTPSAAANGQAAGGVSALGALRASMGQGSVQQPSSLLSGSGSGTSGLGVNPITTTGNTSTNGLTGGLLGGSSPGISTTGTSSGTASSATGTSTAPSSGTTSTASSTAGGTQGQMFGAGAIVGVASVSDKNGIHEFNKKTKYKEWYFVYDPTMDAANPNGGGLIMGPYTGKTFSAANTQVGTPVQDLASPNQPSGFGQPIGNGPAGTSPVTPIAPKN